MKPRNLLIAFAVAMLSLSIAFALEKDELRGRWSAEGRIIQFNDDGTVYWRGNIGRYRIEDGQLVIDFGEGHVERFRIAGGDRTLRMSWGPHVEFDFKRVRRIGGDDDLDEDEILGGTDEPGIDGLNEADAVFDDNNLGDDDFDVEVEHMDFWDKYEDIWLPPSAFLDEKNVSLYRWAKATPPWIGHWGIKIGGRQLILSLTQDGIIRLGDVEGQYEIRGDTLAVQFGPDNTLIHYYDIRLKRNKLQLAGGDLDQTLTFTLLDKPGRYVALRPIERAPRPETPPFTVYRRGEISFGYPRGWAVRRVENGYIMNEPDAEQPAGILLLRAPVKAGEQKDFIEGGLARIRKRFEKVNLRERKTRREDSRVWRLTFDGDGGRYRGIVYARTGKDLGKMVAFYAPADRYNRFDPKGVLQGVLSPSGVRVRMEARGEREREARPRRGEEILPEEVR